MPLVATELPRDMPENAHPRLKKRHFNHRVAPCNNEIMTHQKVPALLVTRKMPFVTN